MNITSKVNKEDMDNARMDRGRASNPADVEPGMDDFDWDKDDSFSSPSSGGWGSDNGLGGSGGFDGPFGGASGGFGGGFGTGGFGGGFNSGLGQPPQDGKKDEDKFFEVIGKIFKGFGTFLFEFVQSFKGFNVEKRMLTGRSTLITGLIVSVIGVLLILIGFGSELGLSLLVGGLVSTGIGVILFMFSYEDFKKNEEQFMSQPQETPFGSDGGFDSFNDQSGFSDSDSFGNNDFSFDDEDDFDMDGDEFDFDEDTEDIDFGSFEETNETSQETIAFNMDIALDTIDGNNGMLTRQYLYENISKCLMEVNPNFDKVKIIDEDSEEFDAWDTIVQKSAGVFKPKGNDIDLPYLLSAKEKLFYYQLEIKRVNWLKNIDAFVGEIVNICRFDEATGKENSNIYGVGNTVGDKIYIKIMKGETAMVTIKDAYRSVETEIRNSKHYMPIVLGVDENGNVIWRDFKDINSILVTGMARSGKSWFLQSMLTQMMFYLKPSELNFYILDPKDSTSSFAPMLMPHIRKFVSNNEEILKELRHVVRSEGKRRKKIIGDAGFEDIWEFKQNNPDIDMPLIYIVIDEVISLAETMDSATKDEFQGLLLELISQLPAYGIRLFMVPHLVKDNILKKSITDLIPCRISVRGDADHIEKSVGTKPKDFSHKLIYQGDMAVRLGNEETMFVHSAVLTSTKEGNRNLFNFLSKFWVKLEPESVKGSLKEKREKEQMLKNEGSFKKGNIEVNTSETPNHIKSTNNSTKLGSEDLSELLSKVHDDDDEIDLWK